MFTVAPTQTACRGFLISEGYGAARTPPARGLLDPTLLPHRAVWRGDRRLEPPAAARSLISVPCSRGSDHCAPIVGPFQVSLVLQEHAGCVLTLRHRGGRAASGGHHKAATAESVLGATARSDALVLEWTRHNGHPDERAPLLASWHAVAVLHHMPTRHGRRDVPLRTLRGAALTRGAAGDRMFGRRRHDAAALQ